MTHEPQQPRMKLAQAARDALARLSPIQVAIAGLAVAVILVLLLLAVSLVTRGG